MSVCKSPADSAEIENPHFMEKPLIFLPGINSGKLDVEMTKKETEEG